MATKKNRLGRGLDSLVSPIGLDKLLPDNDDHPIPVITGKALYLKVELLKPNPLQPRRDFKENELTSLAQSIKSKGIIEPLVVYHNEDDTYELIAGERRLKAAILAGLTEVPVIIRDGEDDTIADKLILALLENLCRQDLNPMEEAESFFKLEKDFNKTHQEIANITGRERPTITNMVRLLKLPDYLQEDIRQSRLTPGHGRAMLALRDHNHYQDIRTQVITKNLTVRQTEALVKRFNFSLTAKPEEKTEEIYFEALAQAFSKELDGLKVIITPGGSNPKIEIFYKENEGLERLMKKLAIPPL